MAERVYSHILSVRLIDSGRRQVLDDIEGSQNELNKLLEEYSIKEHTQTIDNTLSNGSSGYGISVISNHYILVKNKITQI